MASQAGSAAPPPPATPAVAVVVDEGFTSLQRARRVGGRVLQTEVLGEGRAEGRGEGYTGDEDGRLGMGIS